MELSKHKKDCRCSYRSHTSSAHSRICTWRCQICKRSAKRQSRLYYLPSTKGKVEYIAPPTPVMSGFTCNYIREIKKGRIKYIILPSIHIRSHLRIWTPSREPRYKKSRSVQCTHLVLHFTYADICPAVLIALVWDTNRIDIFEASRSLSGRK
jgi:hypothetical protein